jgi:hypothetical protein
MTQMRAYPADPGCTHDVDAGTCFCVDKCAEWLELQISEEFPEDYLCGHGTVDQKAPFHKQAMQYTREHTFSIIASPLLERIPLSLRTPGVWHCTHNCRLVIWIMTKDAAATYGVIDALQLAVIDLGLPHIKVAAVARPKKQGPGFAPCDVQGVIDTDNEIKRQTKESEEAAQDCSKRGSLDGNELRLMCGAMEFLTNRMLSAVADKNKKRMEAWVTSTVKAMASFEAGTAIALADIWATNRANEMGEHFRAWADEICDHVGPEIGMPYLGREYLAILPAHWLCEPDHFEQSASAMWEQHGIAPGSGTDGTTEMVF